MTTVTEFLHLSLRRVQAGTKTSGVRDVRNDQRLEEWKQSKYPELMKRFMEKRKEAAGGSVSSQVLIREIEGKERRR